MFISLKTFFCILPNLFLAGAGKSGTSTLHEYLNQHPQIFMSLRKEPEFFSSDKPRKPRKPRAKLQLETVGYNEGIEAYEKFFEGAEGFCVVGESSTTYMSFPQVIERIQKHIRKPKFIFIFRNPPDRVYSHYHFKRSKGQEKRELHEALLDSMELSVDQYNPDFHYENGLYYYYNGLSARWVKNFYAAFGKESVHILTFEQMIRDPLAAVNGCFEFLHLEPIDTLIPVHLNPTWYPRFPFLYQTSLNIWLSIKKTPIALWLTEKHIKNWVKKVVTRTRTYAPLSPKQRKWLALIFKDDVRELRQITGLSFDEWAEDFRDENID